ncbi:MAG: tyrosine--tRNA ligase, partial [Proteobacteria bacterium]|nr:tyrosine--tRNA ligase [Pseudomonadota bacterium]
MNKEQIVNKILSRGVIKQVLPTQEEFKQKLLSEKPMKFYIGADPTGPLLHLSHAKNFMLLEEFRQLGHKVYVLFGDFTACIGDPSDRDSARDKLTREDAKANIAEWVKHISCLIDFDDKDNPAEVVT